MCLSKRCVSCLLVFVLLLGTCGCSLIANVFSPVKDELEQPDTAATAGYRNTVLYFQTDDGFMVPVMKLLPWEEGIGRVALNQLIDSEENRSVAAPMGLKNTVPKGVSFVLSISDDSVATLNISGLEEFETAEAERAFVCSVVNTLTEFPTIDRVKLLFEGKARKRLSHGTNVGNTMRAFPLNPEPIPVDSQSDSANQLTLYFPNHAASLYIPVTRIIASKPDFSIAMEELVKGPEDIELLQCFPEGTRVIFASIIDDVAVVNFSSEFSKLAVSPEFEESALDTILLTAKNFGMLSALNIQVEGKDYQPAINETISVPVYANEFR